MKVAIMQPYFFPYLGYFSLIKNTDLFILLDEVQFIRHGWIERNRILKQNEGWLYIKVPLIKHSHKEIIKNIYIDNSIDWQKKIIDQLITYKRIAPNFKKVFDFLYQILNNKFETITELNKYTLKETCRFLDIKENINVYSKMNIKIDKINTPDEWALNICKKINNVEEYWNPEGGKDFFDTHKYLQNNINVKFIKHKVPEYNQNRIYFENSLSIIDVLMFNDINSTNRLIDEYYFI